MATFLWNRNGVPNVEFMQQGITVKPEVYCVTQKELHKAIQVKRRGMMTYGLVLLHDNARPHTAALTRALLQHLNRELSDHRPYRPDLATNDYHLFICLKNSSGSQRILNNELTDGVKTWLSS
jgi:hypothetical protein